MNTTSQVILLINEFRLLKKEVAKCIGVSISRVYMKLKTQKFTEKDLQKVLKYCKEISKVQTKLIEKYGE